MGCRNSLCAQARGHYPAEVGNYWIEAVGWVGSIVLVISLLQTRVVRLRVINLVGSAILIGYNVVIEVWPMVGLNVVLTLVDK